MNKIFSIYKSLLSHYGSQNWWPYFSSNREFEICIGAILTQNTSWSNVEKAIKDLIGLGLMDAKKVASSGRILEDAIRPSGYYNQKAERLRIFSRYVLANYGSVEKMKTVNSKKLRKELLQLKGIGPETADSILLYALGKPIFVVDAYTRRLFSRLGLCSSDASYDELQALFMHNLPRSAKLYNEYHALIVQHGKDRCRKKPVCEGCPISAICMNQEN